MFASSFVRACTFIGLVVGAPFLHQQAVTVDTSYYYKLWNEWSGPNRFLAVNKTGYGSLMMGDKASEIQKWRFFRVGDGPKYALRTSYLGDSFSMDVYNDNGKDSDKLWIPPTASATGQKWTFTAWSHDTYRLSNDYTGPEKYLDVTYSEYTPILSSGDYSGQHWSLVRLEKIPDMPCIPRLEPHNPWTHEGDTDYTYHLQPKGTINAVMIFVYPDNQTAPPPSQATALAANLTGHGQLQTYYDEESNGLVSIHITAKTGIGWRSFNHDLAKSQWDTGQVAFINNAVNKFTPNEVNFRDYDVVIVVPAVNGYIDRAATYVGHEDKAIISPSGKVRRAITTGNWDYNNLGHHACIHEFGHCFGLPDVYPTAKNSKPEDYHVGGWDKMSSQRIAGHFLGWHRHKLGWIPEERTSSTVFGWNTKKVVTLSPYSSKCGFVIHSVHLKSNRVVVFEIAEPIPGASESDIAEGVLMYTVDSDVLSGDQPIIIIPKNGKYSKILGNNYLAPFGVGDRKEYRDETGAYVALYVIAKFWDSYIVEIGVSLPKLVDQTNYNGW